MYLMSKTLIRWEYEKSKIDIKLRKKRTTIDNCQSSLSSAKRRQVVTSAETRLHASFPGSAELF
jgi:hypothetical protein